MINIVAIALLLCSLGAPGAKADGKLIVDEKATALKHGCAMLYDNLDGQDEPPVIRLLFSDREIASTELEEPILFNLDEIAQQGKLQGVRLEFDPKLSPREVQGRIYYTAKEATAYPSLSMSGDEAGFTELKVTDDRVSGRAEYTGTKSEFSPDDPVLSYEVTFDLPLLKCSPVKQSLTGAEAVKSPQAQMLLAFEKAVRAGDLKTAATLATPAKMAELETVVKQVGAAAFAEQAKMFIPETAVREKQIEKVVVREKRATLLAKEEGATMTVTLVKVGEDWKLD